ncbi:sensor histidine kinase [Adhaeribacter radiodurans]|uniref:Histidine kinase n=1 Tax=Adhaeribacter radiodurans TaxID=2745197 RepID=A0A7L7L860_9BACT|nr:histidine kinase [Adhaeribacter radiodurans]QMU28569.1 histidine kinase [Adhaeribacter radiodurans]
MQKLHDTRIRIAGMLIQNIILFLFFYLPRVTQEHEPVLKILLWQLLFTFVMWEGTRLAVRFSRSQFTGLKKQGSRILLLAFLVVLLSILVGCWHVWVEFLLGFWQHEEMNVYNFLYSIGMTLFFCQLIAAVYECIYYLLEWKKSVTVAEDLEKRNLQSQLDSLKNQVSPHFLFNSLNTLSGLIEEDPKRALRFVDELSQIYRYLLQSNEKELIPLDQELEFIQAYFYLLQTRFEKGVFLIVEVAPELKVYLIPPLTLQILLENAVKHNIISETAPLHIRIYSDNFNNLLVENNLQKRSTAVFSNKMGLVNVSAKYHLLNQPEIIIQENESIFQVQIPLISPKIHAHRNS